MELICQCSLRRQLAPRLTAYLKKKTCVTIFILVFALVKATSDMMSADSEEYIVLLLLDLFSVFDTSNLNNRLNDLARTSSSVLKWFSSYISVSFLVFLKEVLF